MVLGQHAAMASRGYAVAAGGDVVFCPARTATCLHKPLLSDAHSVAHIKLPCCNISGYGQLLHYTHMGPTLEPVCCSACRPVQQGSAVNHCVNHSQIAQQSLKLTYTRQNRQCSCHMCKVQQSSRLWACHKHIGAYAWSCLAA